MYFLWGWGMGWFRIAPGKIRSSNGVKPINWVGSKAPLVYKFSEVHIWNHPFYKRRWLSFQNFPKKGVPKFSHKGGVGKVGGVVLKKGISLTITNAF